MSAGPTTIDECLATLTDGKRMALEQLRVAIRSAAQRPGSGPPVGL